MQKALLYKILRELLWWAVSVLLVWVIMQPVWNTVAFKFNGIFIGFSLLFFHYFRYIITFRNFSLFDSRVVKFFWFTLNFPLFFYVLNRYQLMIGLFDSFSLFEFAQYYHKDLSPDQTADMMNYIYRIFIASFIGSLVVIPVLQLRIGLSIFRRSKNTSVHINKTT